LVLFLKRKGKRNGYSGDTEKNFAKKVAIFLNISQKIYSNIESDKKKLLYEGSKNSLFKVFNP